MLKAFSRGTLNPPWLPKQISNSFSELQPFYHLSAKVRRRAFLPLPKRYSLLSLNTVGLILFQNFKSWFVLFPLLFSMAAGQCNSGQYYFGNGACADCSPGIISYFEGFLINSFRNILLSRFHILLPYRQHGEWRTLPSSGSTNPLVHHPVPGRRRNDAG